MDKVKFLVIECPKALTTNLDGEYVVAFNVDNQGTVHAGMLNVNDGNYLFERVLTDLSGTPTKIPYKALVQVLMHSTRGNELPKVYNDFKAICMARFMRNLPCFKH